MSLKMSGFLPRDVIKQVQIRPGIYNKDALTPPRKEHRRQLLMEVAESVTPAEEWKNYTQDEKDIRLNEVTNKWKNLRDHFYRDIKLIETGQADKKRKYIYFDDMEFVRPYLGYKLPPTKKTAPKQECEENDTDIDMDAFLKLNNIIKSNHNNKVITQATKKKILMKKRLKTSSHASKEVIIDNFDMLQKIGGTRNPTFKLRESDISFCLSLVPTLRELSGCRKLSAKIEILKVLQDNLAQVERGDTDEKLEMELEEMLGDNKVFDDKQDPLNDSTSKTNWII